jgi:hypothetical protein
VLAVCGKTLIPRLDKPLLQCREAAGRQPIEVACADAVVLHQAGSGQHPKVFADRGPADRKVGGKLADRKGAVAKPFDDLAPRPVAKRVEDGLGC